MSENRIQVRGESSRQLHHVPAGVPDSIFHGREKTEDVEASEAENAEETALDPETEERIAQAMQDQDTLVQDHRPQAEKLNGFDTACLIINKMIGTGIFETPETIWRATGSAGAALLMWCLGAVLAFSGMFVYIELGLTIPRYRLPGLGWMSVPKSGGEKNYLEWLYRRPQFLATCEYAVIFVFLGNSAVNALTFGKNFLQILGAQVVEGWVQKGIALVVVTLACLLHGAWRAAGIWLNNIFAIVKVLTLWFMIIAAFVTFKDRAIGPKAHPPAEDLAASRSFISQQSNFGGFGAHGWIGSALLEVIYAYGGFENGKYVLSEVKDPQKKFPRSSLAAVSVVSISYILTNVAYFIVVAATDFDPRRSASKTMSTVFFENVFLGNRTAQRALPALIAISALGNIIVTTFVASKVKQEIAKEGVLPFSSFWRSEYLSPFARLRSRQSIPEKTPVPALLLHWIASVILVLAFGKDNYSFLSRLYSYMIIACFGFFLAAGLLWHAYLKPFFRRWRGLEPPRWREVAGYTPPLGPFFPTLYLVAALVMMWGAWVPPGAKGTLTTGFAWYLVQTVGISLFAFGLLYWAVFEGVLPLFSSTRLRVTRTLYLDWRGNFRYEQVTAKWINVHAEVPEEEEDPDLDI